MTEDDRPRYEQLVRQGMAGRGKARDCTPDFLDGYWMQVNDLPWPRFEHAFTLAIRGRFWPNRRDLDAQLAETEKAQSRAAVTPEAREMIERGQVYCQRCDDTSWAETTMDARHVYGEAVVEVTRADGTVRATFDPARVPARVRCHCVASNPVIAAKRAMERRVGAVEEA